MLTCPVRRPVAHPEIHRDRHQHERRDHERRRRAERPVAGRGELVLDQVADHELLRPAQQVRRQKGAHGRNEDQEASGHHAGERERQGDPPEPRHGRRAERLGRFQQRRIELLQRGVDRQDHERQEAVHQAEQHREGRVEQGERGVDQAEAQQHGVHQAAVAKQEDHGEGADQKAGPERQHHQEEQQARHRPARATRYATG